jgi:hypothetical protein
MKNPNAAKSTPSGDNSKCNIGYINFALFRRPLACPGQVHRWN